MHGGDEPQVRDRLDHRPVVADAAQPEQDLGAAGGTQNLLGTDVPIEMGVDGHLPHSLQPGNGLGGDGLGNEDPWSHRFP